MELLHLIIASSVHLVPHQYSARAGWSSEINQLVIGEALSDKFDGKILNGCGSFAFDHSVTSRQ